MSASASGSGISSRTVGSRNVWHRLRLDAAAGEDARQQFRQVVALRDRERARRRALVEPVAPGAPARRALDAEEEARAPGPLGYGQGDVIVCRLRIAIRKACDTG